MTPPTAQQPATAQQRQVTGAAVPGTAATRADVHDRAAAMLATPRAPRLKLQN